MPDSNGALAIAYPIHLLPLISSAFVPTGTMASEVRVFAENQLVTSMVDITQYGLCWIINPLVTKSGLLLHGIS